jgi:uncharacterized membrane protein YjjP (DUF1212 family)
MDSEYAVRIDDAGDLLLEIGALLMSSGASSNRVRLTIDRISQSFGLETEMLITNRALMLTVSDLENHEFFSKVKRTSPHGVNFRLVSGISRMSWRVVDEKWDVDQIWKEMDRLKSLPHYPRLVILTLVALAGASFCRLFGGSWAEMILTFIATFAGLFVRQETLKKEFNPYLCVFFASFTASLIAGFGVKIGWGDSPENAFATSVLFLIPGVPLINSFTDLIDGNILNGIVRLVNSLLIAFCIALGLLGAMMIYQMKM